MIACNGVGSLVMWNLRRGPGRSITSSDIGVYWGPGWAHLVTWWGALHTTTDRTGLRLPRAHLDFKSGRVSALARYPVARRLSDSKSHQP